MAILLIRILDPAPLRGHLRQTRRSALRSIRREPYPTSEFAARGALAKPPCRESPATRVRSRDGAARPAAHPRTLARGARVLPRCPHARARCTRSRPAESRHPAPAPVQLRVRQAWDRAPSLGDCSDATPGGGREVIGETAALQGRLHAVRFVAYHGER